MKPDFPPLYAILSAELLSSASTDYAVVLEDEAEFAVLLANAGVGIIQYRNKNATARALFEVSSRISRALSALTPNAGNSVRFIVNDRADIACLAGAGGVHVGQDDLPVDDARAISQKIIPQTNRANAGEKVGVNTNFWVGISTHTLEQVRAAASTSADYIAIGPIFATTTKQHHEAIVGAEFIRQARQLTTKPLVAIGGITLATAEEVFRAGADTIAVARDLICAPDPAARTAEFLAIAKNFRK
jgi:thiamine-phosphate pyrophosphorylase